MEVDYKAIGQRIKIARIKKGVTQETVADLIDITPAHMSNVETGKTKVSLPTLIAIANALSVSVDTLLCDNVIVLWSSIFVTLMANKIGGLQFGIYRNCQISSRVFHTAVAALPLTKANRSDFE